MCSVCRNYYWGSALCISPVREHEREKMTEQGRENEEKCTG